MQRVDYDNARERLLSCSPGEFAACGERFLQAVNSIPSGRKALYDLCPIPVDLNEVRQAILARRDPAPPDPDQFTSFCYALLRSTIDFDIRFHAKAQADAAIMCSAFNIGELHGRGLSNRPSSGEDPLNRYRRVFLKPLLHYLDSNISVVEASAKARRTRLGGALLFCAGALSGGFLTKLGEKLWDLIAK